MANWKLPAELQGWVDFLAGGLHARLRHRLTAIVVGVVFAIGRRTVSKWIVAAGVSDDWKAHYYFLGSVGRNADEVSRRLMLPVRREVPAEGRVLFVIDDSPTKRYGRKVEGAGFHHNPTPGPAGQKFLYGHSWVTLSRAVRHPQHGMIGLPLAARLYIREKDLPKIPAWTRPPFQTKLVQAGELLEKACLFAAHADEVWVAVDGAYAKRPFLKKAKSLGISVVSRLRKDAALFDLPPRKKAKGRGQPRKYGKNRISLAKRAAHKSGWQTGQFDLYGETETKTYKTFLATYAPAGGLIRVVILKDEHGWMAFFSTKPDATVQEILEAVAARATIEQDFHDVKEVHGAGQQQLRNLHANIGAWHTALWVYTLIELWAWKKPDKDLVDRSTRPWDSTTRRPSHADKRNALRRTCMREEFSPRSTRNRLPRRIRRLIDQALSLLI
jgi:SRSO17 transposase